MQTDQACRLKPVPGFIDPLPGREHGACAGDIETRLECRAFNTLPDSGFDSASPNGNIAAPNLGEGQLQGARSFGAGLDEDKIEVEAGREDQAWKAAAAANVEPPSCPPENLGELDGVQGLVDVEIEISCPREVNGAPIKGQKILYFQYVTGLLGAQLEFEFDTALANGCLAHSRHLAMR